MNMIIAMRMLFRAREATIEKTRQAIKEKSEDYPWGRLLAPKPWSAVMRDLNFNDGQEQVAHEIFDSIGQCPAPYPWNDFRHECSLYMNRHFQELSWQSIGYWLLETEIQRLPSSIGNRLQTLGKRLKEAVDQVLNRGWRVDHVAQRFRLLANGNVMDAPTGWRLGAGRPSLSPAIGADRPS